MVRKVVLSYLTAVYLRLPATTACAGGFTDDESTNHFTAACGSATAHASICVLTVSAGYAGGSVTCDTADGFYDVVTATGASNEFLSDIHSSLPLPSLSRPSPLSFFSRSIPSLLFSFLPSALRILALHTASVLLACW